MPLQLLRPALPLLATALFVCMLDAGQTRNHQERTATGAQEAHDDPNEENATSVQYLEIVTPDVDATCQALEKIHAVRFSDPDPALGNARTAALKGGGRIGVRAPMRETEQPVVRPYLLVDDIEAAVEAAKAAGAEIAMPPTEIPAQGTFAIYVQGGIQHGLWQR